MCRLFSNAFEARLRKRFAKRGGFAAAVFSRAQQAHLRRFRKHSRLSDSFWLSACRRAAVPHDSQEHRAKPESADLRFRAARSRDAAFLHDARHSRAAGLRSHGNHRDLHDGRSAPFRAGARRPRDSRSGNDACGQRRNPRARPEYFPRLLATPRGNGQGARRRMVPHRAIRAKWTRTATGASPAA